jgi:hypothetical protein
VLPDLAGLVSRERLQWREGSEEEDQCDIYQNVLTFKDKMSKIPLCQMSVMKTVLP